MIQIGSATLYHGDMREILPTLGECADLVLTDPPYKLISGGNTTGEMGGCFDKSEYDNSGSLVDCDIDWVDFMHLLYRCQKLGTHAYVMANNRNVQPMLNEAEKAGYDFHNLLVWDKGTATPNRWYMKNLEFIGFFKKGLAKYINDCGAKQLVFVPNENYDGHPTVKPVALMENYILQSTSAGDIVVDPFMGVGSTGIAAMRSGRKFIGIEKSEKWFNLAVKRLSDYHTGAKQCTLSL
jgi:site-specific DNA-methyltransferase (adenine-specific)